MNQLVEQTQGLEVFYQQATDAALRAEYRRAWLRFTSGDNSEGTWAKLTAVVGVWEDRHGLDRAIEMAEELES